jgi:hypothetical protein
LSWYLGYNYWQPASDFYFTGTRLGCN